MFNYATIAGIPKQELQQLEGGDTDVGGVTVIFAVTHGGREGSETHMWSLPCRHKGDTDRCVLCVHQAQQNNMDTQNLSPSADNVDTGLICQELPVPA